VIQAEFVISAVAVNDFPCDGLPEVVIAGRSNVGKSSLINRLVQQKSLARTSTTPGKTQSINFYRIDRSFYLVDLPGYGYAKVGRNLRHRWRHDTEQYFHNRPAVVLVVQLVDARMPPTELDMELAKWLQHLGTPRIIVATKADKLSGNKLPVHASMISKAMGGEEVIMSSAASGIGYSRLWAQVVSAAQRTWPMAGFEENS
jgi:GTP-binding protein